MIQFTITIETDNDLLSAKTNLARFDETSSESEKRLAALINCKLGEMLASTCKHTEPGVNSAYMEAPPELFDSMEQAVKANLLEQQSNGGRS